MDHPPPVYILEAWEKRMADTQSKVSMEAYLIAREALDEAIKDARREFAEVRGKENVGAS